jgi:hypothetical protein
MGFSVVIVHEVVGNTSFDLRAAPAQQQRLHDACVRLPASCIGLDISGMVDLSRTYFGALIWPVVMSLVDTGRFAIVLNVPDVNTQQTPPPA